MIGNYCFSKPQKEVKEQKKNLILNKNIDVKTLEDEKDSITFSF